MSKKVVGWFTMNGKHIPVFEGESKKDAANRSLKKGNSKHSEPIPKKSIDNSWTKFENASRAAEYDVDGTAKKAERQAARDFDKAIQKGNANGVIQKATFKKKKADKNK